jgi:hypothetical protein
MYNLSKWGKRFTKLIAASKQIFKPDKDKTFTLGNTAVMLTIVDP